MAQCGAQPSMSETLHSALSTTYMCSHTGTHNAPRCIGTITRALCSFYRASTHFFIRKRRRLTPGLGGDAEALGRLAKSLDSSCCLLHKANLVQKAEHGQTASETRRDEAARACALTSVPFILGTVLSDRHVG